MSDQVHKFRYLLPPGNNFQFVSKFKIWLVISSLLMAASIASLFVNKSVRGDYMNWTIDFKGGTEIILAFKDKTTGAYTKVDPGKVRTTLEKAGEKFKDKGVEVSDITWKTTNKEGNEITVNGKVIRTTRFSAINPEDAKKASASVVEKFKDREVQKAPWSGD